MVFLIALVRNVAAFSTTAIVVGIATFGVFVGSLLGGVTVLDRCVVKERGQGLHQVDLATAEVLSHLLLRLEHYSCWVQLACCILKLQLRVNLPLLLKAVALNKLLGAVAFLQSFRLLSRVGYFSWLLGTSGLQLNAA